MKRLSPSMAVALAALFISLGGTGLAASHYLLTSTKQIKPSVLRSLRGREGPEGPQGPGGNTGAVGPSGPRGPEGFRGAPGPIGGEASLTELCGAIIAESDALPAFSTTSEALFQVWIKGC